MNDDKGTRGKADLPPAGPDDGEAMDSGGRDECAEPRSARSGRPASVRETMVPDRRYGNRSPRRPFPRRKPAPAGSAPPPARELKNTIEEEVRSRRVEVGDEVWTVHVKGSARVGSARGHGARLLSIGFEAPQGRSDPGCTRYLVATRLEDVAEDVLSGLVAEVSHAPDGASGSTRRSRKSPGRGRFRRRGR